MVSPRSGKSRAGVMATVVTTDVGAGQSLLQSASTSPLSLGSSDRSHRSLTTKRGGIPHSVSNRTISTVGVVLVLVMLVRIGSILTEGPNSRSASFSTPTSSFDSINSVNNLRASHTDQTQKNVALRNADKYDSDDQCRFYLAESAIPQGGLGVFTAVGLHQGDTVGIPDICIYVADMPTSTAKWKHMRSHTWGRGNFLSQSEGETNRAACEGMVTTFNTMPDRMVNTRIISPLLPTNAGVDRSQPAAGSLTHHFGIHGEAVDIITAGSELTVDYGDWDFDDDVEYTKPKRSVDWLRENGWCIDHIDIRTSTIPGAGRGAFAKRSLAAGEVVAPAPLQSFPDRAVFQDSSPEQLYVNYCFQPKGSKMMFFPYGNGVNLINHSREKQNVYLQWSTNPLHNSRLLTLPLRDYWHATKPGGIVLEVVAMRDIEPNEELFLDYGEDWENAWNAHLKAWKPPADAEAYIYPADMDETEPLRTMAEQKEDPYPANLITMCGTPDWGARKKNRTIEWFEDDEWDSIWWQYMTYCHILDREMGESGNPVYDVQLIFHHNPEDYDYDPTMPRKDMYIDRKVPRRAIRFVERPYMDDEHIPNAFRHPIELPGELFPEAWKDA